MSFVPGKADLRYIFDEGDEVCFEIHPVYAKNEHQNFDGPQASVVWLGTVNERPKYVGLETTPAINAQIDEKLWEFVKSKKMDEKMFRALVNHFFYLLHMCNSGGSGTTRNQSRNGFMAN